jgi:microcystin-dependent protein
VELADNTETQTGTDSSRAVTPASLASAAALFVPPGAVLPFAMNVVPSGWLAANGATVSRTLYPALFAAIGTLYGAGNGSTTFALPDLRGYFVRGSGTNSDGTAAETFGTKQADAFKSHNHGGGGTTGTDYPDHAHGYTTNSYADGGRGPNGTGTMYSPKGGSTGGANALHQHNFSIPLEGGTENRPKNIALLYCIKF